MKRLWLMLLVGVLGLSLCNYGMAEDVPYRLSLEASVSIYYGPGYDYGYARTVGEDGIYTIVEEWTDEEGNVWGRLKSGAGWVNLLRLQEQGDAPIRASFADDTLLKSGRYQQYLVEDSEYLVKIAIRPRQTLRFVQLSRLDWLEEGLAAAEVYCTFNELKPDMPFVAGVVFYGDMTTYGLSFMDENGDMRCFAFSISGRDGSLIAEEIK